MGLKRHGLDEHKATLITFSQIIKRQRQFFDNRVARSITSLTVAIIASTNWTCINALAPAAGRPGGRAPAAIRVEHGNTRRHPTGLRAAIRATTDKFQSMMFIRLASHIAALPAHCLESKNRSVGDSHFQPNPKQKHREVIILKNVFLLNTNMNTIGVKGSMFLLYVSRILNGWTEKNWTNYQTC